MEGNETFSPADIQAQQRELISNGTVNERNRLSFGVRNAGECKSCHQMSVEEPKNRPWLTTMSEALDTITAKLGIPSGTPGRLAHPPGGVSVFSIAGRKIVLKKTNNPNVVTFMTADQLQGFTSGTSGTYTKGGRFQSNGALTPVQAEALWTLTN